MDILRKKLDITKDNFMNYFFVCLYVLIAISIIANIGSVRMLSKLCNVLICLSVGIVFLYQAISKVKCHDKIDSLFCVLIALLIMAVAVTLINGFADKRKLFSFSYYSKSICFCLTIVFMYIIYNSDIDVKSIKMTSIIMMFTAIFIVFEYFMLGDKAYICNGQKIASLSLNVGNPNQAALLLLFVYANIFIGIILFKNKWLKIASAVLCIAVYLLLYKTKSRNVFIVFTLFNAYVLFIMWRKKIKTHNSFWDFLYLFPIIFSILYLVLIYSGIMQAGFDLLAKMGISFFASAKPIDSRVDVWVTAMKKLIANPILGNYGGLDYIENDIWSTIDANNLHNTLLDIMVRYGCIVFILFSVYMYKLIKGMASNPGNKTNQIGIAVFMLFLMTGIGEIFVLYTNGMFVLFGSAIALAKCKNDVCLGKYDIQQEMNGVDE